MNWWLPAREIFTCRAYLAPFCVRLTDGDEKNNEEIKSVVEPDITIVCDKNKIDEKGCNGTPDLIVEVLSPSSIRHDRVTKFNKYEKAGVKVYLVVEPDQKLVSVFTLSEGKYGRLEMYDAEDKIKVSIFSDLEIDLKPVFDNI